MNEFTCLPGEGRKSLRLGLLGRTLQHSVSEPMWNALLCSLSPGSSYQNLEVEPVAVAEALEECDELGFAGVNVTIPYKELVAGLMSRLEGCALETQAVNCVAWERTRLTNPLAPLPEPQIAPVSKMVGYNTDGPAMLSALSQVGGGLPHRGLVLGSGGAARAAVWALEQLGVRQISVMARRPASELPWFTQRSVHILPWSETVGDWVGDVVVQATPIGFEGLTVGQLPKLRWVPEMVALDLAYGQTLTPFLSLAAPAGARLIDGMEILARQASESWTIWAGTTIPWTHFWDAALGDQPG